MFDRIEFLKEFNGFQPGNVSNKFTSGQADILFRRGIARPFMAPALVVPESVSAPPPSAPPGATPLLASGSEPEKPTGQRIQRRRT
jgi:hypothetical protein